jgi:hypothetical protein
MKPSTVRHFSLTFPHTSTQKFILSEIERRFVGDLTIIEKHLNSYRNISGMKVFELNLKISIDGYSKITLLESEVVKFFNKETEINEMEYNFWTKLL